MYYVDPNPYIKKVLEYNGEENYLIDGVHPNDNRGIVLYSFATLRGEFDSWYVFETILLIIKIIDTE